MPAKSTPRAASALAPISPKDLATELGTDAKTCRKFLRAIVAVDNRPGKGARWTIDADLVPTLKERFATWKTSKSKVLSADMLNDNAS